MNRFAAVASLAVIGAAWGITQPFSKIAVSAGYRHFGLIFWQFVIGALILLVINIIRRKPLPMRPRQLRLYATIAVIGTLFPNAASYEAARFLPSGILSILISTVPMFAFPIALAMGNDRFSWSRLSGLALGLLGVLLIVAPETSLPERAAIIFVPVALISSIFYALESNVVARWGDVSADPIQILLGASLIGVALAVPMALITGSWITPSFPLTTPDYALMASSVFHVLAYTGYVWLIGRTGPTFAAQTGYMVTGFGIIWAMILLGESYSGWIWGALALIMLGVALVKPRKA